MESHNAFKQYFFDDLVRGIVRTGIVLALLLLAVFSVISVLHYPGSAALYVFFSVVSLGMLLLNYGRRFSCLYFFLSIYLFLGFYLKTSVYFVFHQPLLEPTGFFSYSPEAWDKAILISSLGLLGVVCSKILFGRFKFMASHNQPIIKPSRWYQKNSKYLWFLTLIFVFVLAVVNSTFSLYKTGFIPAYHLPFKLGALVPALMNLGVSLWLAMLLWWDIQTDKKLLPRLCAVILSAILFSSSVLSRGVYIYQAGHYVISFYQNVKKITLAQWLVYLCLFFGGLIITVKLSMHERNTAFKQEVLKIYAKEKDNIDLSDKQIHNKALNQVFHYINSEDYSSSGKGNIFLKLAVGRWIGIEGVMAVSSWPNLNSQTFINGWTARLAQNTKNPYAEISRIDHFTPSYKLVSQKFFFSSLPGFIAMLYYSGDLWAVFMGAFILVLFYLFLEVILSITLKNPFYLSFVGAYFSFLISMLGDGHVILAQTVELAAFSVCFYVVQYFLMREYSDQG